MENDYNNENENENEDNESPEVIETIITNISSSMESFNNSLRNEINRNMKSDHHEEDVELVVEYKPTTTTEMTRIRNMSNEFVEKFSYEATHIVGEMVEKFTAKYPEMFPIDVQTRMSMENVLLRNSHIYKKNELIDIKQGRKLLPEYEMETIDLTEFINGIFDGSTQQIAKSFDHNLEETANYPYNFKKTLGLNELFEKANEFKSIWGRSSLYLNAFKIEGKIKTSKRDLKLDAPLLFIPIVIIENEDHFSILFDDERDIEMNVDIIVANNTMNERNTFINKNAFNKILNFKFTKEEGVQALKELYDANGIDIQKRPGINIFLIKESQSLGLMSVYKDSTHFDLSKILKGGFITKNILDMFSTQDPDFKKAMIAGTVNDETQERIDELKSAGEYEVSPITKLNYPQEQAIKNLNVYNNIVIQGPPGTGKTETIVSIISDSILRNKKVLVSSEKEVALDVIYSRLKELAKYSILLTNIEDTGKFYDQMQFMIEEAMKDKTNQSNSSLIMSDNEIMFRRNETRMQIVDFIKTYEEIFMYLRTNEIGKTYSDLYKFHATHRTSILEVNQILKESNLIHIIKLNKLFSPRLYDVLYMLNEKFSYKKENTEFDLDKAVIASYPFLITHTKKHVTTNRVAKVMSKIQDVSEDELFDENGFSRTCKNILGQIFKNPKHLFSYLQTKDEIINIIGIVDKKVQQVEMTVDENDMSQVFESLGSAWMLTFDRIIDFMEKEGKIINPKLISAIIFDNTIKEILAFKESTNPKLQQNISNGNIGVFNKMISKHLSEIIEFNTTLTERRMRDSLLEVLSSSGRMTEIQSFIENNKHANVNKFFEENWKEVFMGVNVWLLPAEQVCAFFPLEPGMFDVVVIDEASQMLVQKAIPLMYRAKQLVISGDDKQLKPSVNLNNRIYYDQETSIIENAIVPAPGLQDALKNKYYNNLINYHYRSVYAELINFSNAFIYKNSLYVSTPKTYEPKNPPIEWIKVKEARYVKGKNLTEVKVVIKRLLALIEKNPDTTIGIVAFTKEQKMELQIALDIEADKNEMLDLFIRTNELSDGEDTSLFVKNVSEVQGDERDNIIFSIGFAKKSDGKFPEELGEISKPHGENRLNVAVTRAKKKIIVVSSLEPGDLSLPKQDIGGNLLKHFLYYAQAVFLGKQDVVRRILKQINVGEVKSFESPMHQELFGLLRNEGYKVEYEFGFDDYKMDFVIRDNETNEVILGINLDNKQYLRNFNTMEREYYLPTYLEARGWNVIRIWSHQWSKDPETENARILKTIKHEIEIAKEGINIVSLFGTENTILDMSENDPNFIPSSQADDLILGTEDMFENAMISLNAVKRELKSKKKISEEKMWMKEYRAIESLKGHKALATDDIIEKEFLVNPETKRIDGIEDSDIDEIIRLSMGEED